MVTVSSSVSRRGGIRSSTSKNTTIKFIQFFIIIALCSLSFYAGTYYQNSNSPPLVVVEEEGGGTGGGGGDDKTLSMTECNHIKNQALETLRNQNELQNQREIEKLEEKVERRVHELLMAQNGHEEEYSSSSSSSVHNKNDENATTGGSSGGGGGASSSSSSSHRRFMKSHSGIANGIARVSKNEFTSTFDYGPPMDEESTNKGIGQDVLILYNKLESIPTSNSDHTMAIQNYNPNNTNGSEGAAESIPLLSTKEATENCDTMNVVTVGNPGNSKQCTALVYNYENYHVQRWMRTTIDRKGKVNPSEPLRAISRGYNNNGAHQFVAPDTKSITKHWKTLYTYLDTLEDVLAKLKPIAESVVQDNTIIVMTCNMGQSELLMNFVCNAKAKGLDVGNVLLFPTDLETKELAEGLGLKTFYDEKVGFVFVLYADIYLEIYVRTI